MRAYQEVGAIKGAINYYRAAVRGYWSPATPRSIPVELPVDLIWGELDTFLGKEMAVVPNTIASNVAIKLLPHVSFFSYIPKIIPRILIIIIIIRRRLLFEWFQ